MLPHPPTWFDWFVVISAIFFSPVFAVAAQRYIDRLREKKDRRVQCYLTLMSLRASPLHPDHIRALNSLDTIFDGEGGQDLKIRNSWTAVLAHVSLPAATTPNWGERFADLRTDLYQAIGKAVGYDHSVDYVKTRVYSPQRYADLETDQLAIYRGLAQSLADGRLKVTVETELPQTPAARGAGR
jgi:hypothetical protein